MTLNLKNLWWRDLPELKPFSLPVHNVMLNALFCQMKSIINSLIKSEQCIGCIEFYIFHYGNINLDANVAVYCH